MCSAARCSKLSSCLAKSSTGKKQLRDMCVQSPSLRWGILSFSSSAQSPRKNELGSMWLDSAYRYSQIKH